MIVRYMILGLILHSVLCDLLVKLKAPESFLDEVESSAEEALDGAIRRWRYSLNFNDNLGTDTKDGLITASVYRKPIVKYLSSPSEKTVTLSFHYSAINIDWDYDLYYHPLWIPINFGDGRVFFRLQDLKVHFEYSPWVECSNLFKLVHDTPVRVDVQFGQLIYVTEAGQGDHYAYKMKEVSQQREVLEDFKRHLLFSGMGENVHQTIEESLKHLPPLENELITVNWPSSVGSVFEYSEPCRFSIHAAGRSSVWAVFSASGPGGGRGADQTEPSSHVHLDVTQLPYQRGMDETWKEGFQKQTVMAISGKQVKTHLKDETYVLFNDDSMSLSLNTVEATVSQVVSGGQSPKRVVSWTYQFMVTQDGFPIEASHNETVKLAITSRGPEVVEYGEEAETEDFLIRYKSDCLLENWEPHNEPEPLRRKLLETKYSKLKAIVESTSLENSIRHTVDLPGEQFLDEERHQDWVLSEETLDMHFRAHLRR